MEKKVQYGTWTEKRLVCVLYIAYFQNVQASHLTVKLLTQLAPVLKGVETILYESFSTDERKLHSGGYHF